MGLGMDIALACDFIIAAPEAQFAASFVKRGLIPDGGGMYFLPRRIGLQLTKELIYSGRTVDAEGGAAHQAGRPAGRAGNLCWPRRTPSPRSSPRTPGRRSP